MAEQLMTLAKTGITRLPEKEIQDLNSVVIRHRHGIEVLNLNKGSPLCFLPLDAKHSTLADVNGDESIDLVKLHVYQENSKSECFLVVSDALVTSSVLFNSSVCHSSRDEDFLGEFNELKLASSVEVVTQLSVKRYPSKIIGNGDRLWDR
jgi:hypothetical protein